MGGGGLEDFLKKKIQDNDVNKKISRMIEQTKKISRTMFKEIECFNGK